jgi:hypothetical protein
MGQSWDIRGWKWPIRPRDKPSGMEQRDLWLGPDRFAAGLGVDAVGTGGFSAGGLSWLLDLTDLVNVFVWTYACRLGVRTRLLLLSQWFLGICD